MESTQCVYGSRSTREWADKPAYDCNRAQHAGPSTIRLSSICHSIPAPFFSPDTADAADADTTNTAAANTATAAAAAAGSTTTTAASTIAPAPSIPEAAAGSTTGAADVSTPPSTAAYGTVGHAVSPNAASALVQRRIRPGKPQACLLLRRWRS